jgi:pimeloyl-ACP methyl ester carboxylesterase
MKKLFLICIILTSITTGYGQNYNDHFDYKKSDISAQIVESQTLDSNTQFEKVVLDGFNSKIPFYHFLNKRNTENAYAILIHGLGGNKNYWVYPSMPYLQYTKNLTAIKDSLLDLGFSLVIIDAKYHGERTYELSFRNPSYLPPQRSQNIDDANIFYDMTVSTVKEVRLIMDYLEEVYKNAKIKFNLVGYSMGGAFSLILNGIEDRINCVVACVPPLSRPFSEVEELNWSNEVAEKMKAISPLYAAKDQKSPVALLMGKTDFFIPEQEARTYYDEILIDDKKIKFYDSGHELPDQYIEDVINWITQQNKE